MSGTECVNSAAGCRVGSTRAGTEYPHPRMPISMPVPPPDCCPSGVLCRSSERPPWQTSRYLLLASAVPALPAAHPASCVPPAVTLNRPELQLRRLRALNAGRAGPAQGPGLSRGRARAGASGAPRQKYLRPGQERSPGATASSQGPLMRKLRGKRTKTIKTGVVAYVCNPSSREVEAGGSQVRR